VRWYQDSRHRCRHHYIQHAIISQANNRTFISQRTFPHFITCQGISSQLLDLFSTSSRPMNLMKGKENLDFVAASCFSCQKIHIIEGRMREGELATENASAPPLINEGSQRDRRRHCRDPLDGVTLSTFPLRSGSLAFFFHFLFSSSSFEEDKDALHDLP